MKIILTVAVSLLLGMSTFANSNANPDHWTPFNLSTNISGTPLPGQLENDGYQQLHFVVDGTLFQMLMATDDGSLFRVIRHYDAEDLSHDILSKLHRVYKGKTILGATKVQFKNGAVYQANLEDMKHIYVVFIDPDGNLHLLNKFNKAH